MCHQPIEAISTASAIGHQLPKNKASAYQLPLTAESKHQHSYRYISIKHQLTAQATGFTVPSVNR
jgi:hypothetical protein